MRSIRERRGARFAAIGFTVLAAALCGSQPAFAADEGVVTGSVTAKLAKQKEGVLVYLTGVPGTYAAPKEHAVINQKDLVFVPRILPVLAGTTVDFLNSDTVRHNVFSPDGEKFNLGTWPKGETRPHVFTKPGVYTLLCNVHPEMEAFVVALENPFFAMSAKDGSFKIEHVPPGKFTLQTFVGGSLKAEPVPVAVTAGGTTTAAVTLKR
jgi:plastocyanin